MPRPPQLSPACLGTFPGTHPPGPNMQFRNMGICHIGGPKKGWGSFRFPSKPTPKRVPQQNSAPVGMTYAGLCPSTAAQVDNKDPVSYRYLWLVGTNTSTRKHARPQLGLFAYRGRGGSSIPNWCKCLFIQGTVDSRKPRKCTIWGGGPPSGCTCLYKNKRCFAIGFPLNTIQKGVPEFGKHTYLGTVPVLRLSRKGNRSPVLGILRLETKPCACGCVWFETLKDG